MAASRRVHRGRLVPMGTAIVVAMRAAVVAAIGVGAAIVRRARLAVGPFDAPSGRMAHAWFADGGLG